MSKQIVHKVIAIGLLLIVFVIPFYIQRSQITSFNNSGYMVGAVMRSSKILSSQTPADNSTLSQAGVEAGIIGDTFIDTSSK